MASGKMLMILTLHNNHTQSWVMSTLETDMDRPW